MWDLRTDHCYSTLKEHTDGTRTLNNLFIWLYLLLDSPAGIWALQYEGDELITASRGNFVPR